MFDIRIRNSGYESKSWSGPSEHGFLSHEMCMLVSCEVVLLKRTEPTVHLTLTGQHVYSTAS